MSLSEVLKAYFFRSFVPFCDLSAFLRNALWVVYMIRGSFVQVLPSSDTRKSPDRLCIYFSST